MAAIYDDETVVVELFNSGEIVHELTEHICRSLTETEGNEFRQVCTNLAQQGNLLELVTQFLNKLSVSFTDGDETRKVFSILFSLMRHLDIETLDMVITSICSDITGSKTDAETRLGVLRDLYCILGTNSGARFTTFLSCLQYAVDTDQENKMLKNLKADEVEKLCKKWGVNIAEQRTLFLTLCDALSKMNRKSNSEDGYINEQPMLIAFLSTYESAGQEELSTVSEYASRAAVGAIKKPFPAQKGNSSSYSWRSGGVTPVYHLAAVQYLQNSSSSQHKGAFAILETLCVGDLQKFNEFANENATTFEALGLNLDECAENMRLRALATLASEQDLVTYSDVASALQVENSEVEKWVVLGITSKLIDAKLDQLNEQIVINRGSQKLFTNDQWADLHSKLSSWSLSVRSVLSTVRQARAEHGKAAGQR